MNQKKCPKCGEMNPPEAVMCWACYTPLTGAAAAVAPAGAGGKVVAPARTKDDDKDKPKVPLWQYAVIGIALFGGLGFGAYSMFGGGPAPVDVPIPAPITPRGPGAGPSTPVQSVNIAGPAGPAGTSTNSSPAPATPYSIVTSPSTQYAEGTMGILVKTANTNVSPAQAAVYAEYARRGLGAQANRWRPLRIFVFADARTAQTFADYQSGRGGQPLSSSDYQSLAQTVWPRTILHYEWNGNRATRTSPQANPTSWWLRS